MAFCTPCFEKYSPFAVLLCANVALIFITKEDNRIRMADKSSRAVQIRDKAEEDTPNKTESRPFTNMALSFLYVIFAMLSMKNCKTND